MKHHFYIALTVIHICMFVTKCVLFTSLWSFYCIYPCLLGYYVKIYAITSIFFPHLYHNTNYMYDYQIHRLSLLRRLCWPGPAQLGNHYSSASSEGIILWLVYSFAKGIHLGAYTLDNESWWDVFLCNLLNGIGGVYSECTFNSWEPWSCWYKCPFWLSYRVYWADGRALFLCENDLFSSFTSSSYQLHNMLNRVREMGSGRGTG